MMKEEPLKYEIAKLANQKGFHKLQCYSSVYSLYDKKGNHVYYHNYGFMGSGTNDGYISAPTPTFLQMWLRNKKDIKLCISWTEIDQYLFEINHEQDGCGGFKTYEEALETGLIQSLKLLKNESN